MVLDVPEGLANCHFGVHPRTEAILVTQQVRLEDRAQHQKSRHLDHTVADARNPKRALTPVAFRNPNPQQGLWPIFAGLQLPPQLFQPSLLPVGGDLVERHLIDARGTPVAVACAGRLFEDIGSTDFIP